MDSRKKEGEIMSRWKKLVILFVALVVITVGFIVGRKFLSSDEENGELVLSDLEAGDIESVRWLFNGKELELKPLDQKSWYVAADRNFPLDQEKASEIIDSVSSLNAVKKISDDPGDLSEYGVNEPEIRIYVTAKDKSFEFDIGDYNESTGYYYMMSSGDPALYYVDSSLYDMFSNALLDLAELEPLPEIDINDVISISIDGENGERIVTRHKETESESEYYEEENRKISGQAAEELIDDFINITWDSCSAYNVKEGDLKNYGLSSPVCTVTLKYNENKENESETGAETSNIKEITLLIGSSFEKSQEDDESSPESAETELKYYYAYVKGADRVYAITDETADAFLSY